MHEMHKVHEETGLNVKTCRRNYSKCTSCTTTARANLDSYSQTYSVFMINARNAPNARDKSMLRANTTNALGAQQLHELYDGSYSQPCSDFTINARNAPNARDRSMLRANTTNAPGARQLHELYDGSYSQSCSVFTKNARNAPNARQ